MEHGLLNRFYRLYRKEIYLYLYSLCGDAGLAEDLSQETFLKALLSLGDQHSNIRAWLYMVARNLYFNHYKREKRNVPLEKSYEICDESETMLERLIAGEERRRLYRALGSLDRNKREVLQMQYFGGLSQKEIAVILQTTPENVRILAFRAKQKLRVLLGGTNT